MENQIEIYTTNDNETTVEVHFDQETVWLTQNQLSHLFQRDQSVISRHINNAFKEGELEKKSNMQKMHIPNSDKPVTLYNLDVIISVGYRVKSKRGTQFRQWATHRLKDYLIQGYAINEKRLEQTQQEVKYLKIGIHILKRVIEEKSEQPDKEMLLIFSKGLTLLDDYDHEQLDSKGKTYKEAVYPEFNDYIALLDRMYSEFDSAVFAKPKDDSFKSSINQIRQSFCEKDLYPSLEEKAATLLYLIVKNHSFVDGNKRIGAACFLYFLEVNNMIKKKNGEPIISNEALATLTLFIASSKNNEMETIKQLIISILNRNQPI